MQRGTNVKQAIIHKLFTFPKIRLEIIKTYPFLSTKKTLAAARDLYFQQISTSRNLPHNAQTRIDGTRSIAHRYLK